MKSTCLIVFLFCVCFVLRVSGEGEVIVDSSIQEGNVPFLTSENFFDTMEENPISVVLFTRTEGACPECDVAFEAINEYSKEDLDCPAFMVDCQNELKLCQELHEFRTLPQILMFVGEIGVYEYEQRYVYHDALREFVLKHLEPKLDTIRTPSELEDLMNDHKVLVVGFFVENSDKVAFRGSLQRTAGQLCDSYHFVEVVVESEDDLEAFQEVYGPVDGSIKMIKTLGNELNVVEYTNDAVSRRRITSWIRSNTPWPVNEMISSPTINPLDENAYLPLLTVYADYRVEGQKEEVIVLLERISEEVRGKITLTYMDGSPKEFEQIFVRWGFQPNSFPTVMLVKPVSRDVYTFSEELTEDSLREFTRSFLDGERNPHIIKQTFQEEEEGLIQTLVHDNWRERVLFSQKDVAVVFYLPEDDCPHCEDFIEIFEETASHLENQLPDLTFGKLDVFLNAQVPGVRVSNFPSVMLYKRDNKFSPVEYSGPRRMETLSKFLQDHLIREEDIETIAV